MNSNRKSGSAVLKVLSYILMIFFTILTIGPLVWLFYSSFKPHNDIVRNTMSLPVSLYLENFVKAWKLGNMGILFFNSIMYSVIASVVTAFLALSTGYSFAKLKNRATPFLYGFFTLGLLITVHSVLVPVFVMETKIGIDNTRMGVIIPYIAFGLPFGIYLATSYLKGLPDSLEEAAVIDGASYLEIFYKIIIPVATPIIATMLIFTFLSNWNEFILVLTLTSKISIRSLPVGINAFAGGMSRDYGLQFAALVIGTIPMIIFYMLFHKQLAKGFAAGVSKE